MKDYRNVAVQIATNLTSPAIGIVMTPFYISKIGYAGLGIIAFTTMLNTVFGIFISGIIRFYEKDVATAAGTNRKDLRALYKGGFLVFLGLGFILGFLVFIFSFFYIDQISLDSKIPKDLILQSIIFLWISTTFAMSASAIVATLSAMSDFMFSSIVGITNNILLAVATWWVLSKTPSVHLFYLLQTCSVALYFILVHLHAKKLCKRLDPITARSAKELWLEKFKAYRSSSILLMIHEGISVLITQIDRTSITKFLDTTALATYNIAANPAKLISSFLNPIGLVTYPNMCKIIAHKAPLNVSSDFLLRIIYVMSSLACCAILILSTCGQYMLELWLGKGKVPINTLQCLILSSIGQLLLCMLAPFYNFIFLHQQVKFCLKYNIIAFIVLLAMTYPLIHYFGIIGASIIVPLYAFIFILAINIRYHKVFLNLFLAKDWLVRIAQNIIIATMLTFFLNHLSDKSWIQISYSFTASVLFFIFCILRASHWNIKTIRYLLQPNLSNVT